MRLLLLLQLVCIGRYYGQVADTIPAFQKADSLPLRQKKAFNPGTLVLNANIGYPQVSAIVAKTILAFHFRYLPDETVTYNMSNSGVLNAKVEYGLNGNRGIGATVSYWNMGLSIHNTYTLNGAAQTDDFKMDLSVIAFAVKGNYHLVEKMKNKIVDPYFGFTIGASYTTNKMVYTSTNPSRQIPKQIPKILYDQNGWWHYLAVGIGIRVYVLPFLGVNVEAGWDKGALLFAGAALKIGTKPPKFLRGKTVI